MKLPDGCGVKFKKNTKVEREIFGLKQSGRKGGRLWGDTLIAEGCEQCRTNPCISARFSTG